MSNTIKVIEALYGDVVQAEVCGNARDSPPLAVLIGRLERLVSPDEIPETLSEFFGDEAITLVVGDDAENHLSLWPDRFIAGRSYGSRGGVEIITRDGILRIEPNSWPWID